MELNTNWPQNSDVITDLSNNFENDASISGVDLERLAFSYLRPDSGKQEIKLISRILPVIENEDPTFFQKYLTKFLDSINEPIFGLHFLCVFSNRIFKDYKNEVTSEEFWRLVQSGLTLEQCSLTRKRGLYLAKRFTDDLESFKIQNSKIGNLFRTLDNKNSWEDFFLILECLEEKQVHIIQQILNKLHGLQDFDTSWVAVVFKRFFAHQNIIVVRWGVERLFEFVQHKYINDGRDNSSDLEIDDYLLDLVVHDLLQTLNMTKLYNVESGEHSGKLLSLKLTETINTLAKKFKQQESKIVNAVIKGMCQVSWGPLPLFWMTDALVRLECGKILEEKSVDLIMDLVEHHIVYQEPVLRGAAQQNLLIFVLSKSNQPSINNIGKILHTFWTRKVLFANTQLWHNVSQLILDVNLCEDYQNEMFRNLSKISSSTDVLPFNLLEKSVYSCMLPSIVIAADNYQQLANIITQVFTTLKEKPNENRLYASNRINKNFEESLRLKYLCLKAIKDILCVPEKRKGKLFLKYADFLSSEPETRTNMTKEMNKVIVKMIDMQEILSIIRYLMASDTADAIRVADIYIELLEIVTEIKGSLLEDCANMLSGKSSYISKAIAIKVILHFAKENPNTLLIKSLKLYFSEAPVAISFPESENREEQKVLGAFNWQFRRNQLDLAKIALKTGKIFTDPESSDRLYKFSLESLDLGGTECVISAVHVIQTMQITSLEFIQKVRKMSAEFRKNESYWPVMNSLVSLLLDHIICHPNECSQMLVDVAKESNITPGLMALIAFNLEEKLFMFEKDLITTLQMMSLITRMITFGPSFRKDQKFVTETNKLISDQGLSFAVNLIEGSDHELSDMVRKKGMNLLFNILQSHPDNIQQIMGALLQSYAHLQVEVTKGRIRHFENSEIHKCKHRMLQCLLFTANFVARHSAVDLNYKIQLIQYFLDQLLEHNDQTSVRHLLEWCSTVLIGGTCSTSSDDSSANILWTWLEKAAQVRPGSVPSFIIIIVNLAKQPGLLMNHKEFLDKAITEISPWSMAQQYGLRVVSQIGFSKLWPILEASYPDLVNKYQVLNSCMRRSVELSASDKTAIKLTQDFYQSVLDPVEHMTLEDVFIHFPYLCCLPEEEISSLETLAYLTNPALTSLRRLTRSILEGCQQSKLVCKDPLVQHIESSDNVQRKITPWKSMNIETEQVEEIQQRFSKRKEREYEGLIVIASLIDRLPNLGGLCRTCEILGVGKMTIPSAAAIKERDFTGVSVTAEQWLPMEEVPENKLLEYIKALKSNGWSVVAIEQASKSVPLQTFKFPEKCAILLGKEREGVPVEILNYVDDCIEIPQHGLIRSLNVHVTGSIVLWEYVRQKIQ